MAPTGQHHVVPTDLRSVSTMLSVFSVQARNRPISSQTSMRSDGVGTLLDIKNKNARLTSRWEQSRGGSSCGRLESCCKMLSPPASRDTGCDLQRRHTETLNMPSCHLWTKSWIHEMILVSGEPFCISSDMTWPDPPSLSDVAAWERQL